MNDRTEPMPVDGSDAALALDFALGVLGGIDRQTAQTHLLRNPGFIRDVENWQALLVPLAEDITPVAPPATAWSVIESRLFHPTRVPGKETTPQPMWSSLAMWQSLAVGASAVAALAIGMLATRSPGRALPRAFPAASPRPSTLPANALAASMASTEQAATVTLTATYDPQRGTVALSPAAKDDSRSLAPELWVIVGQEAPQSLGVIDLRAHKVPGNLEADIKSGATLAISLEPAGGSPTGAPTGPVVAAGKLAAL